MEQAEPRRLAHLFDREQPNHPALDAALLGSVPASAVVDDAAAPANALLHTAYGFAYSSLDADPGFLGRAVDQVRREVALTLIWPDASDSDREPPANPIGSTLRYGASRESRAFPPPGARRVGSVRR